MIEYATYNAMMHSNTISYTSSPINYKLNDTYHIITMHKISSRCRYPSSNPIFLSTVYICEQLLSCVVSNPSPEPIMKQRENQKLYNNTNIWCLTKQQYQ